MEELCKGPGGTYPSCGGVLEGSEHSDLALPGRLRDGCGTRILVSDPEGSIRALLRRILERQGYSVDALANPGNLTEELAVRDVDLVIADLDLPDAQAIAAADAFRRAHQNLDVILLSGCWLSRKSSADAALRGIDVLRKPFRTQMLLDCVESMLSKELIIT